MNVSKLSETKCVGRKSIKEIGMTYCLLVYVYKLVPTSNEGYKVLINVSGKVLILHLK